MATTIHFGEDEIAFHYGIREYFDELDGFPMIEMLCDTDPYADATFGTEDCKKLQTEVRLVRKQAEEKSLPVPPDLIVSETPPPRNDDDQPFGWSGLSQFLKELDELLDKAIQQESEVLVRGD